MTENKRDYLGSAKRRLSASAEARPPRCCARGMHPGVPQHERPEAEVRFHASPCQGAQCLDRLLCVGHPVCTTCAISLRANDCVWDDGADVELYWVHS